jgi:hypothetical protein
LTNVIRLIVLIEAIVAESVVVIKKLLQLNPEAHKDIIVHMAKLAHSTTVPAARASILWMIGVCVCVCVCVLVHIYICA